MKQILKALVSALLLNISLAEAQYNSGNNVQYPAGSCGPEFGNHSCDNEHCCSQHGYCGIGDAYCGVGCQNGFGKACDVQSLQSYPSPATFTSYASISPAPTQNINGAPTPPSSGGYQLPHVPQTSMQPESSSTYKPSSPPNSPPHPIPAPPSHAPVPVPPSSNAHKSSSDGASDMLSSTLKGFLATPDSPSASTHQSHDDSVIYQCKKPNQVALTFDDGPGPLTSEILQILAKRGVLATFFCVGSVIQKLDINDPTNILRNVHRAGHQIAGHSWSHTAFTELDEASTKKEIQLTNDMIKSHIGLTPRYMRLPYGSGDSDQKVVERVKKEGVIMVQWNFDSLDWQDGDIVVKYRNYIAQRPQPQSIISLNHDIQTRTRDSLDQVISLLQDAGYTFVTVAECNGDPNGAYTNAY